MNSVLAIKDLKVGFKTGFFESKEILHSIGFEVPQGKIFGFLGPNGSGKTTTIKTVLGLIPEFEGVISIFNQEGRDSSIRQRIGFAPENAYFSPLLTPREVLNSMGRLSGMDTAQIQENSNYWLKRLNLDHVMDSTIQTFSKGMRQRLNLVQALLHDPELLILDEPTTGLDPIGRKEIKQLIVEMKEKGKTVLVCTHNLLEAQEICDEICIIYQGNIIQQGVLAELLPDSLNLEEYFIEQVGEADRE